MAKETLQTVVRFVRDVLADRDTREHSDGALLRAFVSANDQRSFTTLVKRHGAMVLAVGHRVLHQEEDAEDAFQATFLLLAREAVRLRGRESLGGWLHGVAYHMAKDLQKAAGRRRKHENKAADAKASRQPDVELAWREVQAILDEEIERLPAIYLEPFILCCLENKSCAEAAQALQLKEGTVWSRLGRAKKQLQGRLTKRGVSLAALLSTTALSSKSALSAFPVGLISSTIRAAAEMAASPGLAACTLSPKVAALLRGATKSLVAACAKTLALVVVSIGSVAMGIGVSASTGHWSSGAMPIADQPSTSTIFQPDLRRDSFGDPLPESALARLGTRRLRHGDSISTIGFLADGKSVLSADHHGARIWEVATGRFQRELGDRSELWLQSSAFSRDGRIYVRTESEGRLEIWDAIGGRRLRTIQTGRFPSARIAPRGDLLAVSEFEGNGKLVRDYVLDVSTAKVLYDLDSRKDGCVCAFSADGKTLVATGVDGGPIRFLDALSGRPIRQIARPSEFLTNIALSPDGKILAALPVKKVESTTSLGHSIMYFDLEHALVVDARDGKSKHKLARARNIHGFTPDGLLMTSMDKRVCFWDVSSGKEVVERSLAVDWVMAVALSPDGRTLATGGSEQAVRLWDVATSKEKEVCQAPIGSMNAVAISPDGRTIATGGQDRIIRLWDPTTGKERARLVGHTGQIGSLAFSLDGKELVSSGYQDSVRIWDVATCSERGQVPGSGSLLAADGNALLTSSENKNPFVWNLGANQRTRELLPLGRNVPIAFANNNTFVTWGDDKILRFCDLQTGKVLRQLPGHRFPGDDRIYVVAIAPDGRHAAFGGQANEIAVYDLATGKELGSAIGRNSAISAVAFSPDGKIMASADWTSGTIDVWEVSTFRKLQSFVGHQGRVFRLAFSSDGSFLVSGSEDTTALVWDLTGRQRDAKSPATALSAEKLQAYWADLSDKKCPELWQIMASLAGSPKQTLPLIRQVLVPIGAVDSKLVARLLGDIEKDDFATRQRAAKELQGMGEAVELALRRTLESTPPAETAARCREILEKLQQAPDRLRKLRAFQILERIPTAEARQLLSDLAQGAPDAWLTADAKAALERRTRIKK